MIPWPSEAEVETSVALAAFALAGWLMRMART